MSELLDAVYRGDTETVEQLLADDPELDVFEAAAVGDVGRLRELLDEDPPRANAFAEDGFQPLGLASFFAHLDAVRVLLERGADVNSASRNTMRVAPIHSAAAVSDPEARYAICELLLEHGADPNVRQQDDYTPLMEADQHGDARLRDLLVRHGATE
jgi:ankyrin repeat protein